MALLISILIPGTCALFGLLWLDLTTRFVKEAHYIFIIEHKIKANLSIFNRVRSLSL